MLLKVRFAFIGEGTSDNGLVPLLRDLCVLSGADATEMQLDWNKLEKKVGRSVSQKAKAALEQVPNLDLLFIHRDADERDAQDRYQEIAQAIESLGVLTDYVAVVPVQETEAWLLLDENAIREVAGKPKGRVRLNLPTPNQVENISNPKERLKELLAKASELKGRRLKRFQKSFPLHRWELLQLLDYERPLAQVPAFKRLVDDISQAMEKLKRKHNMA